MLDCFDKYYVTFLDEDDLQTGLLKLKVRTVMEPIILKGNGDY